MSILKHPNVWREGITSEHTLKGSHPPDTSSKQKHCKKILGQSSNAEDNKNPQQNTRKLNWAVY